MIDTCRLLRGLVLTAAMLTPAMALAAPATALLEDGRLVAFDSSSGKATSRPMQPRGVEGQLVAIDVRPKTGMLYGITDKAVIYMVDLKTGMATSIAPLKMPTTAQPGIVFDFNPVADRIRLMTAAGANFRINPDTAEVTKDGDLKYDPAEAQAAKKPMIVAGAYTNSYAGTKETALYTIDGALGQLNLQAPPNDGVQKARGPTGMMAKVTAFDIMSDGMGGNGAAMIVDRQLYVIEPMTGATSPGPMLSGIEGTVIDFAFIPAAM